MSCNCHSDHDCCKQEEKENNKALIIRLSVGAVLFACGLILNSSLSNYIFIAAYLLLGYDVLFNAVKDIKHIFNESFLMSIATIGAIYIGGYPEAAAVMLFYQIGELLSDLAVDKSKDSITALMDLRADTAHLLKNGEFVTVPSEDVAVGDVILVSAGEKIPLDGEVISGSAFLDNSALTGESIPVKVSVGTSVLSGSLNSDSALQIKVTKEYSESTASKILELVQTQRKSNSEKFITKFARVYTPVVVLLAAIIAIVIPLIFGNFNHWFYTAMMFLVVSCPCALVVSVPLSFFSGIGCCSKNGILVKGAGALEALGSLKNAAFDKTGTITEGKFKLREINTDGDKQQLLEYAAYCEYHSSHPIAKAIVEAYGKKIDYKRIFDYHEIAGNGIQAAIDGNNILIGTKSFLETEGVKNTPSQEKGSVFLAVNGSYYGCIIIDDMVKTNSAKAMKKLKKMSIKPVMLTGDSVANADGIAKSLRLEYFAGLLPQDKVKKLEDIKRSGCTAFIGDGINDAPVISVADVGIAMGGVGSDAAIEASDAVIMGDDLEKLPLSVSIAKKTLRIVWQNVVFAITVKALIMLLGLFGLTTMWVAIFSDVGVCLLAVLNSLRAFKIKQ